MSILKLDRDDNERELEFELKYQLALSTQQRFEMMFKKSKELADMMIAHGHRKPVDMIKRR